jgi:hypothetical protein
VRSRRKTIAQMGVRGADFKQPGRKGGAEKALTVTLPHFRLPPRGFTLKHLIIFVAALLSLSATGAVAQQQVVIVTSFPKELTEAYKKAFEAKNPGIKVEILNKPTPAGVAYVREAPATNKPDVFWVSAPDAKCWRRKSCSQKLNPPRKKCPPK